VLSGHLGREVDSGSDQGIALPTLLAFARPERRSRACSCSQPLLVCPHPPRRGPQGGEGQVVQGRTERGVREHASEGGRRNAPAIAALEGDGVRVDLTGSTFISKNGVTSSTFKTVPDVPVSSFELYLPQGRYSALASNLPLKANGTFCAQRSTPNGVKLAMPTEFVAQNGAVIHESTPIAVTGCPPVPGRGKANKAKAKKAKARKATKAKKAGNNRRATR
jgi:hypothetical protein